MKLFFYIRSIISLKYFQDQCKYEFVCFRSQNCFCCLLPTAIKKPHGKIFWFSLHAKLDAMWKKAIVLIVTFCASLCDGATRFDLNFVQSTNKVIVTDFYYMLEYSIVRGRHTEKETHERF